MGRATAIRSDLETAASLRRLARKEKNRRTVLRMLAIANAMDGMKRAEAAHAAGIERQSLCDAIQRYNKEGLDGLRDKPKGHRPPRLSEAEQAELVDYILHGPDPERGEPSSWTLPDLCRFVEARFNKTLVPQSMSRVLRRRGLSRQKARPLHPQRDEKAVEAFKKGGSWML